MPDHIDAEHFGTVRPVEFRMTRRGRKIAKAEFAIAIDRRGPHQIADIQNVFDFRLLS